MMTNYIAAAALFKTISSPIRLEIIRVLRHEERSVSELLSVIQTSQPNMSQHLSSLEEAGVLAKRREGVKIFYRVQDHQLAIICDWLLARQTQ